MGHTNSTANLSLPQFIGTDKPTWLGDVNGAFSSIDAYVGTNDAAVSAAAASAANAVADASAAVNTANNANTTAGNASSTATAANTVAGQALTVANSTDAKVGALVDLDTTDKSSIVNAINEAFDEIPAIIWTNPDITQPIAAGTLFSVSTNGNFGEFLIVLTNGYVYSVPEGTLSTIRYYGVESSVMAANDRSFTITKSGNTYTCVVDDASDGQYTTYGSAPSWTTDNTKMIPKYILGVK